MWASSEREYTCVRADDLLVPSSHCCRDSDTDFNFASSHCAIVKTLSSRNYQIDQDFSQSAHSIYVPGLICKMPIKEKRRVDAWFNCELIKHWMNV